MNVDPQSSNLAFLDRRRHQNLERNAIHNIKIKRWGYDKEG
jgi:hypothetical protein